MGRDYWYCIGVALTAEEHTLLKKLGEKELEAGFGGEIPILVPKYACVSFWLGGSGYEDLIPKIYSLQDAQRALEAINGARQQWHLSGEPMFVFMTNDWVNADEKVVIGQVYRLDNPLQTLTLEFAQKEGLPVQQFKRQVKIRGDQGGVRHEFRGAFKWGDFGLYFGNIRNPDDDTRIPLVALMRVIQNGITAEHFFNILNALYVLLPDVAKKVTGDYDPARVGMILWNSDASEERFEWPLYDALALAREVVQVPPPAVSKLHHDEQEALTELEQELGLPVPLDPETAFHAGYKVDNGHIIEIHLTHLNLERIPSPIAKLSKLQGLDLNYNTLREIPLWIGKLANLQELYIGENWLKFLPDSIGELHQLRLIVLFNNQLTSLPPSFGNLVSLQQVRAFNNKIRSLPDSFGELKELETLEIQKNQLCSLPDSFGQLIKLKRLELLENQLETLPRTFGNLVQLEKLDLYYNRLHSLPENINQMRSLRWLNVEYNKLEGLPEGMCKLTALEVLKLGNNIIPELPPAFGNLRSLQELSILNNPIFTLPESFKDLENLREFNLSRTGFMEVPQYIKSLPKIARIEYIGPGKWVKKH